MRTIERASSFKRDYRKAISTPHHRKDVEALLVAVLRLLIEDQALPESYRDHSLGGNWIGYRDCHLKPDLLLIYSKPDADTLRLARLGSHSELFG